MRVCLTIFESPSRLDYNPTAEELHADRIAQLRRTTWTVAMRKLNCCKSAKHTSVVNT